MAVLKDFLNSKDYILKKTKPNKEKNWWLDALDKEVLDSWK